MSSSFDTNEPALMKVFAESDEDLYQNNQADNKQ